MPTEDRAEQTNVLTMEQFNKTHQQQPSPPLRKRSLPSIDTSLPLPSSCFSSSSASTMSNTSNNNSRPHTPSSTKKPLVFKKPTKHEFTWSELSKIVASKDLTPMGRSEVVQDSYQKAIKRRTKKYGSPDEYIRQKILHWPPADKSDAGSPSDGNESSGSSCSSYSTPPSSPTGPVDPLEIVLKKNEFPYSVKKGIEHWLIWSRHALTDEVWIRRFLEERLPGRDYLYFINPPELRSVPSIFHVQVFTKGGGEVLDEEDMEIKKEEQEATAAAVAKSAESA